MLSPGGPPSSSSPSPRSERYHDHLHEKRKSKVFFVPSVRDRAKMSGKSRVVVDRSWGGGKRNERGGGGSGRGGHAIKK